MQENFGFDPKARPFHCAIANSGPGSGRCKDKNCGQVAPVLFSGYCGDCAPKHGVNLITLTPDAPEDAGGCNTQR